MPSQGFWTGATGLLLHQTALDVVANNVANLNTTAFKSRRVHFQDILSREIRFANEEAGNLQSVNPVELGIGAQLAATEINVSQGSLEQTEQPLDVAIQGQGFFVVRGPDALDNELLFTRDGHFTIDAQGTLPGVPSQGGPIQLLTRDGLPVLGVNATVGTNGQFALPAAPTSLTALEPISFDPTATLPAHQTTSITMARNLDSQTTLAIPATTLELVDGSEIRLEFERASPEPESAPLFFFRATSTTPNAQGGFDTLNDTDTGLPIEGTIQLGGVSGVFLKGDTNGDGILSAPEVAALTPWTQKTVTQTLTLHASGNDNQTYLLDTPPVAGTTSVTVNGVAWTRVAAFTGAPNEYLLDEANGRITFGTNASGDAPPAGADIVATYQVSGNVFTVGQGSATVAGEAGPTLAAPAPFTLSGGANVDAGSLTLTMNGKALTDGVDYNLDLATGEVTPLTAWSQGDVIASYTTNGGATQVNEAFFVGSPQPTRTYTLAQVPVAEGTVVVNGTRGGNALVEGIDYTVDEATGAVMPLTFWDPGTITTDYQRADTRSTVLFAFQTAEPGTIPFRVLANDNTASGVLEDREDFLQGTSVTVFDANDNAHSLSITFERLSTNRWLWRATPTLREALSAANVTDATAGGGTTLDGLVLSPPLARRVDNPNFFQVTITVDEGAGPVTFTQVEAGQAFSQTGPGTRFFRVEDPTTGEIAFSRDLDTTAPGFSIQVEYTQAVPAGSGVLAFDEDGNFDATNSFNVKTLTFTTSTGTAIPLSIDFTQVTQTASPTDVIAADQDGFAAGEMTDWRFQDDGKIVGLFDNGLTQDLAQLVLARFQNPAGLSAELGANLFRQTANVGALIVGTSGQNGLGVVLPGFLEASNTDLSEELANMILFQRAYQFNSRTITTQDELIREAISMKR